MRAKIILCFMAIPIAISLVLCGEKGVTEPELKRGKLVRVTNDGGTYPDWSEDGSSILYCHEDGDTQTVYSISPAGGQPTVIVELTALSLTHPRWHPDMGAQLVAFLLRAGPSRWAICTYDIAAARLDTLLADNKEFTELDFTRDGDYLAFVREPSSTAGIWLIPTAGGEARRITKSTAWYLVDAVTCDRASDTVSYLEFEKAKSAWNLFNISLGGGEPFRVTNLPTTEVLTDQERSPDGTQYLIRMHNTTVVPYRYHIFLLPAQGGQAEQITTMLQNSPVQPTWSPDGTAIAFHRWEPDRQLSNIFYVDLTK